MAEITAAIVKELREKSGAGMMDCKKALTEANGDLEAAVDWLRKKGLATAAKKAGRVAAQGLVALKTTDKEGVVVEVNSETDFVSKNELFQNYVKSVAEVALKGNGDVETLKTTAFADGKDVQGALTDLIAKIGENMSLRRSAKVSVNNGVVVGYMHSSIADGLGKIGTLVALESTGDKAALEKLAKNLAMHVAAAAPVCLNVEDVPAEMEEREKNVVKDQIKEEQAKTGKTKPADVIEKMMVGRIRKFHEEIVLNEQFYIMDDKKKVKEIVAEAAKEVGAPVTLKAYVRFALGEGIEKKSEDFAAEVAAAMGNK
ncbi:MAG: translation elongation factor Ts [Alphaproteobacteria bacterium]|nr:translation elongation factor Ts [Alphaproteobacteria bacterium]